MSRSRHQSETHVGAVTTCGFSFMPVRTYNNRANHNKPACSSNTVWKQSFGNNYFKRARNITAEIVSETDYVRKFQRVPIRAGRARRVKLGERLMAFNYVECTLLIWSICIITTGVSRHRRCRSLVKTWPSSLAEHREKHGLAVFPQGENLPRGQEAFGENCELLTSKPSRVRCTSWH